MGSYSFLEKWYKRITWFGIFLNLLFVIPCFFFPEWILGILDLEFETGNLGANRWNAAVHHQRFLRSSRYGFKTLQGECVAGDHPLQILRIFLFLHFHFLL